MRISTTTAILSNKDLVSPEENIFHSMRLCVEAGFEHLDLHFGVQGRNGLPLATDDWERWVDRIGEEAERLHVTFYQAHSFHYRTRESTGDLPDRPFYEERMRRSVLAAERLGVKWLVQHPSDFNAAPTYDFERTRRFNIEYWTPFVELAEKHHVGVAFENLYMSGHHQRYCSTAEELLDFISAFEGAPVGVCWDTGHAAVAQQDEPASIRMLGDRMKAMHIHDNHRQPKGDEHLTPYMGTLDWDGILQALADIDYQHNFSFEAKHPGQELPPSLTLAWLKYLRAIGQDMLDTVERKKAL
ncbi:MAG: sugar phosphate isomerase/epimerase, partial [Clostridia bacterium]|nr:sugar phosphate isomerase/epimerase [Clostridia bacterium]